MYLSKHNFYLNQMHKCGASTRLLLHKSIHFFSLCPFSVLPDWFIFHVRIPGGYNADQRSDFCVLLDFHDGSVSRLEDGRFVYVRNADTNNGLISK